MKYVEFIVFIARIAHEVYLGTKQEGIGLHLKCDKVLKPLLEQVNAEQIFSFKPDDFDESEGGSSSGGDESDSESRSSKSD